MSEPEHEIWFCLYDCGRYGVGRSLFPWNEGNGFGPFAPEDIQALDGRMRRHLAGEQTSFPTRDEAEAAVATLEALLFEEFKGEQRLVPFVDLTEDSPPPEQPGPPPDDG